MKYILPALIQLHRCSGNVDQQQLTIRYELHKAVERKQILEIAYALGEPVSETLEKTKAQVSVLSKYLLDHSCEQFWLSMRLCLSALWMVKVGMALYFLIIKGTSLHLFLIIGSLLLAVTYIPLYWHLWD